MPFPLGWHTILAHPRVRGSVNVVAAFFCGLFLTGKRSPALGFRAAVCPPIHSIYIAPLCSALAPQRRNTQLLTHAGPGPLGVGGESAHRVCTGSAQRCRIFYVTNLTTTSRAGLLSTLTVITPSQTTLSYWTNESNRRAICTLSEFITRYLRVQQLYQTFIIENRTTSHTPLGGDFLLTETASLLLPFSEERLS